MATKAAGIIDCCTTTHSRLLVSTGNRPGTAPRGTQTQQCRHLVEREKEWKKYFKKKEESHRAIDGICMGFAVAASQGLRAHRTQREIQHHAPFGDRERNPTLFSARGTPPFFRHVLGFFFLL